MPELVACVACGKKMLAGSGQYIDGQYALNRFSISKPISSYITARPTAPTRLDQPWLFHVKCLERIECTEKTMSSMVVAGLHMASPLDALEKATRSQLVQVLADYKLSTQGTWRMLVDRIKMQRKRIFESSPAPFGDGTIAGDVAEASAGRQEEEKRLERLEEKLEIQARELMAQQLAWKKKLEKWKAKDEALRTLGRDSSDGDSGIGASDAVHAPCSPRPLVSDDETATIVLTNDGVVVTQEEEPHSDIRAKLAKYEEELRILRAREAKWVEKEEEWVEKEKRLQSQISDLTNPRTTSNVPELSDRHAKDLLTHQLQAAKTGWRELKMKYDDVERKLRLAKRDLELGRRVCTDVKTQLGQLNHQLRTSSAENARLRKELQTVKVVTTRLREQLRCATQEESGPRKVNPVILGDVRGTKGNAPAQCVADVSSNSVMPDATTPVVSGDGAVEAGSARKRRLHNDNAGGDVCGEDEDDEGEPKEKIARRTQGRLRAARMDEAERTGTSPHPVSKVKRWKKLDQKSQEETDVMRRALRRKPAKMAEDVEAARQALLKRVRRPS
eukprot:GEMP01027918.1.p1 GENE.GEMP01027918.1~~GEMP01027918.1.p1  ORF type:complete len:560 (+),score=181.95 GEMP01027918.1:105-1784(+)